MRWCCFLCNSKTTSAVTSCFGKSFHVKELCGIHCFTIYVLKLYFFRGEYFFHSKQFHGIQFFFILTNLLHLGMSTGLRRICIPYPRPASNGESAPQQNILKFFNYWVCVPNIIHHHIIKYVLEIVILYICAIL